jgi:hypothetical protein
MGADGKRTTGTRNVGAWSPRKTTVAALRRLPVRRGPGGTRGRGADSLSYEVRARLVRET